MPLVGLTDTLTGGVAGPSYLRCLGLCMLIDVEPATARHSPVGIFEIAHQAARLVLNPELSVWLWRRCGMCGQPSAACPRSGRSGWTAT